MVKLGSPKTGERESEAVRALLEEGTLSTGEVVEEFETEFAALVGREYGVAVCSGGVALELSIEASPLEPGNRVAVSPFNCAGILYALLRMEVEPVFTDCRRGTFNLSPAALESAAEAYDLDGLLVTHLFGQPCDMDRLQTVAAEHDLVVIDDFAQAPGAEFRGRPVGSYGELGICSFGATKNITTGEGGMVVTDDRDTYELLTRLRSSATGDFRKPLRSVRMSDIEATIGKEQLGKYDTIVRNKRRTASVYREQLPPDVTLPEHESDRTHVYHGFPVRTEANRALQQFLGERNVETSVVYDQPIYEYETAPEVDPADFPVTHKASRENLLLPIHANVTEEEAQLVAESVTSFFEGDRP